jgi:hypothetical protein
MIAVSTVELASVGVFGAVVLIVCVLGFRQGSKRTDDHCANSGDGGGANSTLIGSGGDGHGGDSGAGDCGGGDGGGGD